MSLFQPTPNAGAADSTRPLADRMRPRTLDEYAGQEHLIGPGKPLRVSIERDDCHKTVARFCNDWFEQIELGNSDMGTCI